MSGLPVRWAYLALAVLAATVPGAAHASTPVVSLDGTWKFRPGDDPAWAAPGYDDRSWAEIEVPTGWGPPGYHGPPVTLVWYRKTVEVPEAARGLPLGLALGDVDSAYEAYAGGVPIGSVGALPPRPAEDYTRRGLFAVPASAVDETGRLVVALRIWTPATTTRMGAPYSGSFRLGAFEALAQQEQARDVPLLALGVAFAVVGVFHLWLRWRGPEHVWFGVLALELSAYTLLRSQYRQLVFDSFLVAKEIEHGLLYVFGPTVVAFLWPLLGRPIGPAVRVYQVSSLAAGALVVATPGLELNLRLLPWWELHLLIVNLYAIALLAGEARAGGRELRAVACGFAILAVTTANDSARDWSLTRRAPRVVPFGFVALVVSMTITLSRRFRRAHAELIALQGELERRVAERTTALEERTRELAEANAAKGRFLATVSHEVRTPLNGILGVSRLMLQSGPAGRQRELAEIVHAQGRALHAIIDDILDHSKMEAGRLALEPADFALAPLLREVARPREEQARARGVKLRLELDGRLPEVVHADALRLRQILDNLLANAVKFTDRGSVVLRARPLSLDGAGAEVRFEVEDTGVGIDEATLPTLFQPFTQSDAGARHGGTGLGLAIAKTLVEMMGGEIGVRSVPASGSIFWFRLCLAVGQGAAPQDKLPFAPQLGRHLRVLVAEDHEVSRMVTVAALREAGCTAGEARNGREAVEACARERWDLVLMDCRMPEMDGYAAAAAIRAAERERRTPIVALTAHALPQEEEKCRAAGMDDFLTKPIDPSTLARMLQRWLPGQPQGGGLIDHLRERSPALRDEVAGHYLRATPDEIAALEAAIARGDHGRAQDLAHDLAGSALVVGGHDLARLFKEVEAWADGHLSPAPSLAPIRDAFDAFQSRLARPDGRAG